MSNAAWGAKRTCPKCSARFYDLGKMPVHCPKCGYDYDPALLQKSRRGRKKVVEEKAKPVADIKKADPKKKVTKDDDDIDLEGFSDVSVDGDGIEEMEEVDAIENLEEISEIDDMEEDDSTPEDDADEETILEEMDTGDKTLIDDVDEDEDTEDKD